MNKAELIKAVEARLQSDRKTAQQAVDHVVDIIVRSVAKGERVAITGFGVFEKRRRGARTARNPATGASVKVKATSVPAFRAGTGFKEVVSGAKKLDKVVKSTVASTGKRASSATKSAGATKSAAKAAPRKRVAAKSTTKKAVAKTTGTRKTAGSKATARKTTARKTGTKKAAAKRTTAKRSG